jgi:DNA-binding transcriptional regulator YiaG
MALGNQIRHHRLKQGLKLEQLSELSGVDVGTISALEVRDSKRSQYAGAIARGLGMTVEELTGEGGHGGPDARSAGGSTVGAIEEAELAGLALADVLQHGTQANRQQVLDAIRLKLLRARARYTAEEFANYLDTLDRLEAGKGTARR